MHNWFIAISKVLLDFVRILGDVPVTVIHGCFRFEIHFSVGLQMRAKLILLKY